MTNPAEALKTALEKYDHDMSYGQPYPSAEPVVNAARRLLTNDRRLVERLLNREDVHLPDGWTLDIEQEGGQPNGIGEIEDNYSREWFNPDNETHRRSVINITGPWVEGPTEPVRLKREAEARRQAQLAQEREDARLASEPDEALLEVAKGLYGAQRLKDGLDKLGPWSKLSEANKEAWTEEARRFIEEEANRG
jgi:hypothetical protein